ncbi:hypothetical protein QWM81_29000, partial [Streptomyces ficellus]
FAEQREQIARDSSFAQNAILNPLKDKRVAAIERIAIAIDRIARGPNRPPSTPPAAPPRSPRPSR